MRKSYVVWFTGLSGSGKSTLANALAKRLSANNYSYEIVDGDEFRKKAHPELRFSKRDIKLNQESILKYCQSIIGKKDFVLVPVIAPFRSTRKETKKIFGKFYIEVYCKISFKDAVQRDTKGLYKRALSGGFENLVGFSKNVPYEEPENPELIVNTGEQTVHECTEKIFQYIANIKQ